jgi:hypothetical protein
MLTYHIMWIDVPYYLDLLSYFIGDIFRGLYFFPVSSYNRDGFKYGIKIKKYLRELFEKFF